MPQGQDLIGFIQLCFYPIYDEEFLGAIPQKQGGRSFEVLGLIILLTIWTETANLAEVWWRLIFLIPVFFLDRIEMPRSLVQSNSTLEMVTSPSVSMQAVLDVLHWTFFFLLMGPMVAVATPWVPRSQRIYVHVSVSIYPDYI